MTDKIDDGGPAFPQGTYSKTPGAMGMSLRDWFAGQCLIGIMAGQWTTITAFGAKSVAKPVFTGPTP